MISGHIRFSGSANAFGINAVFFCRVIQICIPGKSLILAHLADIVICRKLAGKTAVLGNVLIILFVLDTLNTALLLLLLLVCSLGQPGSWFLSAVLGVLLGESLCLLPLVLRQLPLPAPLDRHQAVLWCGVFSVLLVLLWAVSCLQEGGDWFLSPALPLTLYGLALPWSLVGIFRYLPCSRWYRGALGCVAGAVWQFCLPWTLQRLTADPVLSWDRVHPFGLRPDFTQWADPAARAENVMALICLGLLALGAALALAGRLCRHR